MTSENTFRAILEKHKDLVLEQKRLDLQAKRIIAQGFIRFCIEASDRVLDDNEREFLYDIVEFWKPVGYPGSITPLGLILRKRELKLIAQGRPPLLGTDKQSIGPCLAKLHSVMIARPERIQKLLGEILSVVGVQRRYIAPEFALKPVGFLRCVIDGIEFTSQPEEYIPTRDIQIDISRIEIREATAASISELRY